MDLGGNDDDDDGDMTFLFHLLFVPIGLVLLDVNVEDKVDKHLFR